MYYWAYRKFPTHFSYLTEKVVPPSIRRAGQTRVNVVIARQLVRAGHRLRPDAPAPSIQFHVLRTTQVAHQFDTEQDGQAEGLVRGRGAGSAQADAEPGEFGAPSGLSHRRRRGSARHGRARRSSVAVGTPSTTRPVCTPVLWVGVVKQVGNAYDNTKLLTSI